MRVLAPGCSACGQEGFLCRGGRCVGCRPRAYLRFPKISPGLLVARTCGKCGELKAGDLFHLQGNGPGGRASTCKACRLLRTAAQEEALVTYQRAWRIKNRDKGHAYQMKTDYGLAHGEFNRMLADQGGVCAVCHQPETRRGANGLPRRLSVDHDHATGAVRGLLCDSCNNALGRANDDPQVLRALAEYLEERRCVS